MTGRAQPRKQATRPAGPLDAQALVARLAEKGVTVDDPDQLMAGLEQGAISAESGQILVGGNLIEGCTFTHRLTVDEVMNDWVRVHPDLSALAAFADRFTTANGRGELQLVTGKAAARMGLDRDAAVLTGPPGWLGDALPGRLVGFRHDHGAVAVRPVGAEELEHPDPAVADALLASVAARPGGLGAVEFAIRLLVEDHARFLAPSPPLADVLAGGGLVATGDRVGGAGGAADRAPVAGGSDAIPGVSNATVQALHRVSDAAAAHGRGEAIDAWEVVARDLAAADVAGAFAEQTVGGGGLEPAALGEFLATVEAKGAPSAGLTFLRARVAEALQRTGEAEDLVQAVLRDEPAFGPALVDAAWFASDRGNATRAATLLAAAGIGTDDPELRMMRRYAAGGPHRAGRNDPCPCGSGRKYKSCCSELHGWPLAQRVSWLHGKAISFAQRPPQRHELFGLARGFAGLGDAEDPAQLVSAACDPIVVDLCLFEGGMLRRFATDRGALLPADERALLDRWVDRRHTLFVRGAAADGAANWFDVIGDAVVAGRTAPPRDGAAHALGVAVPTGDGDPVVLGTPRPVPASQVDALEAALRAPAGPTELAALVGRALGWGARAGDPAAT